MKPVMFFAWIVAAFVAAGSSLAQDAPRGGGRGGFGGPIALGPDDKPAFPDPPAGFNGDVAINDQRPKFLALLANQEMSKIVVEHKDCASRFGVASIQTLLAMQDRELVIVNTADTEESDLMGDFVAIITSFAARLYGRRRAKRKTEQVLAALQQNGDGHEPEARKRNEAG